MDFKNVNLPGWFEQPGAYVLVDGQFGSTGKGLIAGFLAEYAVAKDRIPNVVTTNAGPNSGHTAYFSFWGTARENPALGEQGYAKVMTQQIPVASVFLKLLGHSVLTYLNAGAILDTDILNDERMRYNIPTSTILINPACAVISPQDREDDQAVVGAIAGTGKGIGPAIAGKVMRRGTIARDVYRPMLPLGFPEELSWDRFWDWESDIVFVETAQGFSLGLNSARFHPHTTSRECTVMQAISDARIPPSRVKKTLATFRTFPIRVGNTPTGFSGNCYPDQRELTWEEVGVPAELTTVTKRVRRVFSWSRIQFRECIAANEPDVIFLNFCNYLSADQLVVLLEQIAEDYRAVLGRDPDAILTGYGPHTSDIRQVK